MLYNVAMNIFRISFYDKYKCLMGDCPESCCKGFSIPVEEKTYQKLLSRGGLFAFKLRLFVSGKEDDRILNRSRGKCPYLGKDKLCLLQKQGAPQPHACVIFPRRRINLGALAEETLDLSCPECARLFLKEEFPLKQIRLKGEVPYGRSGSNEDYEFLNNVLESRARILDLLKCDSKIEKENDIDENDINGNIINEKAINGNGINGNGTDRNAIDQNAIKGNAIKGNAIGGNAITGNDISRNAITGNVITAKSLNKAFNTALSYCTLLQEKSASGSMDAAFPDKAPGDDSFDFTHAESKSADRAALSHAGDISNKSTAFTRAGDKSNESASLFPLGIRLLNEWINTDIYNSDLILRIPLLYELCRLYFKRFDKLNEISGQKRLNKLYKNFFEKRGEDVTKYAKYASYYLYRFYTDTFEDYSFIRRIRDMVMHTNLLLLLDALYFDEHGALPAYAETKILASYEKRTFHSYGLRMDMYKKWAGIG